VLTVPTQVGWLATERRRRDVIALDPGSGISGAEDALAAEVGSDVPFFNHVPPPSVAAGASA
jgi:hypothetical protein